MNNYVKFEMMCVLLVKIFATFHRNIVLMSPEQTVRKVSAFGLTVQILRVIVVTIFYSYGISHCFVQYPMKAMQWNSHNLCINKVKFYSAH